MTRHDIRFRRQTMSSGRIQKHKNYQALLQRHKRTSRMRLMLYFIIAILMIALAYGLIYYISATYVDKKTSREPATTSAIGHPIENLLFTKL